MEIEVLIADIVRRVHAYKILEEEGQLFLFRFLYRQKVNTKYSAIDRIQFGKVSLECLLGHGLIPGDIELTTQAADSQLFEESRNTASNLQIANHKLSIADNLFRFSKISHIALIINSSREIPCPLLLVRSPRNNCIRDALSTSNPSCKLLYIALDDGLTPRNDCGLLVDIH